MAGSGPSSSSSVYNSADEIDPMVLANDSAEDAEAGAKEKEALVEGAPPQERRRRLWRFRDSAAVPEPLHPTWASRLMRYFAMAPSAVPRRSVPGLSEAEAVPAAAAELSPEARGVPLNLNPLYEPMVRAGEAEAVPVAAGGEPERYEEVGVACCLPCRRRKLPRSARKLSTAEMPPSVRASTRRNEAVVVNGSPAAGQLVLQQNHPPPLPPPRAPGHPLPSTPVAAVAAAAVAVSSGAGGSLNSVHSQIDYQHHFIPDLEAIYSSPYYWGVMDRFEAGEVLSNKPAGSFLLRDSAQNNFLFSISFRGYGRTLHARVDVQQHHFSLDCCDPQVAKAGTVMGLMAVYQNRDGIPSESLATAQLLEAGLPAHDNVVHPISIYEPTLKLPVFRGCPFSLQDIARAALCSHFSYDQVQHMRIPCHLRGYTNYYHYKHPVRVREVAPSES